MLSGAPHFHFVIPVKMNQTAYCGASVAAAGISAHTLMADCVFDAQGYLTQFRVNSGSYFTLNNIHGKSSVEGNAINSPFLVRGVKFNLKGGTEYEQHTRVIHHPCRPNGDGGRL